MRLNVAVPVIAGHHAGVVHQTSTVSTSQRMSAHCEISQIELSDLTSPGMPAAARSAFSTFRQAITSGGALGCRGDGPASPTRCCRPCD